MYPVTQAFCLQYGQQSVRENINSLMSAHNRSTVLLPLLRAALPPVGMDGALHQALRIVRRKTQPRL